MTVPILSPRVIILVSEGSSYTQKQSISESVAMVSLQSIAARPVVWLCPPWLYQPGPPRVQWDADGRGEQAVS